MSQESKKIIESTFKTEFSREGSIAKCELYYKGERGELLKKIER